MNKTQRLINRILEVDNFQNVACVCENWEEFCFELEEWGVTSAAKIEFDDAELDVPQLDAFIKAENGYIRTDLSSLIDEGFHDLELLKKVITQIKEDESIGDYTAIDYLFKDISRDHLEGFLSEEV